jgi:hypothetical protein
VVRARFYESSHSGSCVIFIRNIVKWAGLVVFSMVLYLMKVTPTFSVFDVKKSRSDKILFRTEFAWV